MVEEITGFVCWVQIELQPDVNQTFDIPLYWIVHCVFFMGKVRLVIGGESWLKIWQNHPSRPERNRQVWHRVVQSRRTLQSSKMCWVGVCMTKCLSWGNHVTPPPIEIRGCVAPQVWYVYVRDASALWVVSRERLSWLWANKHTRTQIYTGASLHKNEHLHVYYV